MQFDPKLEQKILRSLTHNSEPLGWVSDFRVEGYEAELVSRHIKLASDVNFTLRGQWDRDDDRTELYRRAAELGNVAWASESQFCLLTPFDFGHVCDHLGVGMYPGDFLKVQEVNGRFFVAGGFPPRVNALFEQAQSFGIIEVYVPTRRLSARDPLEGVLAR